MGMSSSKEKSPPGQSPMGPPVAQGATAPSGLSSFFSQKPTEQGTPAPSGMFGQSSTPAPAPAANGTPSTGIFGGTRRKKRSTKNNKTRGRINFSKIKWGSFTKIYNNYIKKHPHMKSQIPDLKHFAHYVNKHPSQFNKKTHKKALFYINIIEK